jgi:phosphoribosylformylglycinamidine synthase
VPLHKLEQTYDAVLESIYPVRTPGHERAVRLVEKTKRLKYKNAGAKFLTLKPQVLIPVFSGTNCEYDSAAYVEKSGALPKIFVLRTRTPSDMQSSIIEFAFLLSESEMLFIPSGISNGGEPDGGGKFIANFLRNPYITEEITKLLNERNGLILGISNGFQALIKLGLVPYGKIIDPIADTPTIKHNLIARHQSKVVRVRIISNLSPWLAGTVPGEVFSMPISSSEARFICSQTLFSSLSSYGQIATQYVDSYGVPSMSPVVNPAGSFMSVEGLTSPDGRVFGKMGHSERSGRNLYKNIKGNTDMKLFESAMKYFAG